MRSFICFVVVVLSIVPALILPASAEAKHPFTFEEMMSLKRVGNRLFLPMENGCCSARLT